MQSYPDLQPLYDAARSYLEIPQRINLLNSRVEERIAVSSIRVSSPTDARPNLGTPRHASVVERVCFEPTRRASGEDRHRIDRDRDRSVPVSLAAFLSLILH